ncbi:MAG: nickel pincer cofactor biosynthesis protein LarB [Eggerthellaceae bacterium]|nr:nickel pincer cofactor biosynthesis protein LarB [Eggerthellaceae bacterium]
MDEEELKKLFDAVANGSLSIDDAVKRCKIAPFVDLGYAKVDTHRNLRQGVPEVIFGEGKNALQIEGISRELLKSGSKQVLITRLTPEKADKLKEAFPGEFLYVETGRIALIGHERQPDGNGIIYVVCAGTSDLPVAEEAIFTSIALGNKTRRIIDVGVAGIHRLLSFATELEQAQVVIAVAGMEGALPSVVSGMVSCPVIAVPTSIGYGASFNGLSALLAMLNSCSSGVSVVNIDNGFGAAYQASLINHLKG